MKTKKRTLTRAMREATVRAMVADLWQPRLDAALKHAGNCLSVALAAKIPDCLRVLLPVVPEGWLCTMESINIPGSRLRDITPYDNTRDSWKLEVRMPLPAVVVTERMRHFSYAHAVIDRLTETSGDDQRGANLARKGLDKYLAMRTDARTFADEADRTLSAYRTVEQLVAEWPEAAKWIPEPEPKPLLPAVRISDLAETVAALAARAQTEGGAV
jgi:hypothetical protein